MKLLTSQEAFQNFQSAYEACSDLAVPLTYLQQGKVYGLYKGGAMISGYVIASSEQLRTVEVFSSLENRQSIYTELGNSENYCEVCCFWIDKTYRKNWLLNIRCWLAMAATVERT